MRFQSAMDLNCKGNRGQCDDGGPGYHTGDRSDAVYFLASGRVKISRLSDNGKEFILEIVEPGSFFGETGVLNEEPRETVAEVLEPSTLHVVPETVEASLQLGELVLMGVGVPDLAARKIIEERRQAEQTAVDEGSRPKAE